MEILSLLLIPIAGAVIGYSTNMLAITMLFRPHHEIRLFGRRLPFTPGLIPRQQQQLAKKMANSLAENILTSESLVAAASNTGIVDNIVAMVQDFAHNIATSNDSVSKILADALGRDETELITEIAQNSEKLTEKTIDAARKYAQTKALPYLQSEAAATLFIDFAKNLLEKPMPQKACDAIKATAKGNMHKLAPIAKKLLADEKIDTKLRDLVGKIAKENAPGGILGLFVNTDKIYNSIVHNLLEYLENPTNHAVAYEKLEELIDKTKNKQINELLNGLNGGQTEDWLNLAVAYVQNNMQQEHIAKVFDGLEQSIDMTKAVAQALSLSPSQIMPANADYKTVVDKLVRNAVTMLTQKAGAHIVGALDIAKIAEDRINAFETIEMERLIHQVVGGQLKWIVRLGGLLGFIMGFFPAILSVIT